MSQLFVLPSLEILLIAGRAVALVTGLLVFAWAFRHWRRAATRDAQRVFEQLDLVRSELLIMKDVMHHAAHRVDPVVPTAMHESRAVPIASNGGARSYEIAARMVRSGAGKDELIRSCGITTHEAELLIKLHGQRRENTAELIGRQPRLAESSAMPTKAATSQAVSTRQPQQPQARPQSAGQSANHHSVKNTVRPTAGVPRQNIAAAAAVQRTPERATPPVRAQNLPPRSRLVAVG